MGKLDCRRVDPRAGERFLEHLGAGLVGLSGDEGLVDVAAAGQSAT